MAPLMNAASSERRKATAWRRPSGVPFAQRDVVGPRSYCSGVTKPSVAGSARCRSDGVDADAAPGRARRRGPGQPGDACLDRGVVAGFGLPRRHGGAVVEELPGALSSRWARKAWTPQNTDLNPARACGSSVSSVTCSSARRPAPEALLITARSGPASPAKALRDVEEAFDCPNRRIGMCLPAGRADRRRTSRADCSLMSATPTTAPSAARCVAIPRRARAGAGDQDRLPRETHSVHPEQLGRVMAVHVLAPRIPLPFETSNTQQ